MLILSEYCRAPWAVKLLVNFCCHKKHDITYTRKGYIILKFSYKRNLL
jgi:hypothetical protein